MVEHEQPASQEPLTDAEIHFGLVVGVPYRDGVIPSVVLEKLDHEMALTSRIMSDIEGEEVLSQGGTSTVKTMQRLNRPDMTREQIVRGFMAGYEGHFPQSKIEEIVDAYIAKGEESTNG